MKIKELLFQATQDLQKTSLSARLDSELLLAEILHKPKTYLFSHNELELTEEQLESFQLLLAQRLQGKPIAYILGRQAFWDFELKVNENVLIPRPETEILVEALLQQLPKDNSSKLADLGTGSGAIAIAIAKERPNCEIIAVDISQAALQIAEANAKLNLVKNISFQQGNWCKGLPQEFFDVVVANPPYISEADPALEKFVAKFEPKQALISGETGLESLQEIIQQARGSLKSSGYLALEHGYQQAEAVKALFQEAGYSNITTVQDYAGHSRLSMAQK